MECPYLPTASLPFKVGDGHTTRQSALEANQTAETDPPTLLGPDQNCTLDGVVVRTETAVEPGEVVQLLFTDLAGRPVEVCGTVQWRRDASDDEAAAFCLRLDEITDEYLAFYNQALTW